MQIDHLLILQIRQAEILPPGTLTIKIRSMGNGNRSRDLLLQFWDLSTSRELFEVDNSNCAIRFLAETVLQIWRGPKILKRWSCDPFQTRFGLTFRFFLVIATGDQTACQIISL